MYERFCRRNDSTPTFEEFNRKNYTCLPANNAVFEEYSRHLLSSRRAAGIPVTRRLPSLFKKLSSSSESISRVITPSVQVRPQTTAFKSAVLPIDNTMRMDIRAPNCIPVVKKSEPEKWSREAYAATILKNKSILLHETKGHMVHLVPELKSENNFAKLACKLTKSTWEVLRGKSMDCLKMRDGSSLDVSTVVFNEGDLAEFVHNRKKKIEGPHFIRFSRI